MKKFLLSVGIFLPLLMACGSSAQAGSTDVEGASAGAAAAVRDGVARQEKLGKFSTVSVEGIASVEYVTQAGGASYELICPERLADKVKVSVAGGCLRISTDSKRLNMKSGERILVRVKGPALSGVSLTGTGSFKGDRLETSGEGFVRLGGTGNLSLDRTEAGSLLKAELDGTGNLSLGQIRAAGEALLSLNGTGNLRTESVEAGKRLGMSLNGTGLLDVKRMDATSCSISLNGTGNCLVDGLRADGLNLALDGTGRFNAAGIEVRKAEVRLGGTGNLALSGTADDLLLANYGLGSLDAGALKAKRADVRVKGNGTVACHADETLRVKVTGRGRVTYSGNPAVTDETPQDKRYLQHVE